MENNTTSTRRDGTLTPPHPNSLCPSWCLYQDVEDHGQGDHYGEDRYAVATADGPWFQTVDDGALFSSAAVSAYQQLDDEPAKVYLAVNQVMPPRFGCEGGEKHASLYLTPLEAVALAQQLLATAREVVDGGRS